MSFQCRQGIGPIEACLRQRRATADVPCFQCRQGIGPIEADFLSALETTYLKPSNAAKALAPLKPVLSYGCSVSEPTLPMPPRHWPH